MAIFPSSITCFQCLFLVSHLETLINPSHFNSNTAQDLVLHKRAQNSKNRLPRAFSEYRNSEGVTATPSTLRRGRSYQQEGPPCILSGSSHSLVPSRSLF